MRLQRIFIIMALLCLGLISCRETMGEQHEPMPQENNMRESKPDQTTKPQFKKEKQRPFEYQDEKEVEHKKTKAGDTLKPKIALR